MIVNKYDRLGAFQLLSIIKEKLDSTKSTYIFKEDECTGIVEIVEAQNIFCLQPFDENGREGFNIYNIHDTKSASSNNPLLHFTEGNVSKTYLRQLHNIANTNSNYVKAGLLGFDVKSYYQTQNGMPKSFNGLRMMGIKDLI